MNMAAQNDERKDRVVLEDVPAMMSTLLKKMDSLMEKVDSVLVMAQESIKAKESGRRTMNAKEVCDMLGIKQGSLYHMTSEGKIPCYRVGGKLVFFESEIIKWVEERRKLSDTEAINIADEYLRRHF